MIVAVPVEVMVFDNWRISVSLELWLCTIRKEEGRARDDAEGLWSQAPLPTSLAFK